MCFLVEGAALCMMPDPLLAGVYVGYLQGGFYKA